MHNYKAQESTGIPGLPKQVSGSSFILKSDVTIATSSARFFISLASKSSSDLCPCKMAIAEMKIFIQLVSVSPARDGKLTYSRHGNHKKDTHNSCVSIRPFTSFALQCLGSACLQVLEVDRSYLAP
jgi:hypothetical protein